MELILPNQRQQMPEHGPLPQITKLIEPIKARTRTMNTQIASATTTTEGRQLVNFTLDELKLSPINPRQSVSDTEIDALAGSIRSVGLLQNLAGIQTKDGIEIVAGGRRLRALKRIAEQDSRADMSVPVILAENDLEAQAWANSENTARSALHPADEVRAYRQMSETGCEETTIAKAFAVTLRHVKGRLRLASLPEPILTALAEDVITLDAAAAFTVSGDAEAQMKVFADSASMWNPYNPSDIRRRLTAETGDATDQLAVFVGREAYEAEGGAIREDLFGEDVYFLDQELLARVAATKLAETATGIEAEGWKWVETAYQRLDYQRSEKLGRTYPEEVELEGKDGARYDALQELVDDGEASDAVEQEFESLAEKLGDETFTAEQKAHAGVYVWINYKGEIERETGLILPNDRKAAEEAGVCAVARGGAAPEKPKGPYTAALADDLARIRTGAIQTALLAKPELALDLVTFILSTSIYSNPLGISKTAASNASDDTESMTLPDALQRGDFSMPLRTIEAVDAFAEFRAKPKKERNRILTENVAIAFSAGLADDRSNPFVEAVADQAATNIRGVWTPTSSFFSRLKPAQLDDIISEIEGAPVDGDFSKLKKKAKVVLLDQLFNDDEVRDKKDGATKARIAAWVPVCMAVQAVSSASDGASSPADV